MQTDACTHACTHTHQSDIVATMSHSPQAGLTIKIENNFTKQTRQAKRSNH